MRMFYEKKHQCQTFLNWHIIPLLEQNPIYAVAEYEQNCLFSEDKNGHMLIIAILYILHANTDLTQQTEIAIRTVLAKPPCCEVN
ncbi:hypothetical protein T05_3198 [Trichinella murrelli]|uniref:Uncharacterized protein n=1 Tax=Trichinella murrelli TaxID=144512 RepID=A0A0V0UED1_9BILA|nr:hypothetical protein T05_3198 [Trichinella murrelli]